jgi:prevent-host-death family protein
MTHYGVAEARNNFTHLLERVEDGERIIITRHGKVIAEIVKAAPTPEPKSDGASDKAIEEAFERLRIMRESLPPADMPAAELIRQLRDEGP